jgi:hypothetical protein
MNNKVGSQAELDQLRKFSNCGQVFGSRRDEYVAGPSDRFEDQAVILPELWVVFGYVMNRWASRIRTFVDCERAR